MANYNITITNGSGSSNMKKGSYNVSVVANGYNSSTLEPTSYTVSDQSGSESFTLTANGTLTITVNETGAAGGTPITSGTIVMTSSDGNTQYGSPITIDSTGNAVFNNVPFGTTESPYVLYFKQLSTDESHNINTTILNVSLTSQTQTAYLQNTPLTLQSFTLTDKTYTGLPVANATLTFTGE